MSFPTATKNSALFAGVSLGLLLMLLDALKSRGVIPYDIGGPELFPFVLAYSLVTMLVFVFDVRNLPPKNFGVGIFDFEAPKDNEGHRLRVEISTRMLHWFLGLVVGGVMGLFEVALR
jgi:hypothetical protein